MAREYTRRRRAARNASGSLHGFLPVAVALFLLCCSLILFLSLSVPDYGGLYDYSDSSEGVSTTVNGSPIGESAVTAYIENFRAAQGLDDESSWGKWLVRYGYTPQALRIDTITMLAGTEVMRQAAASQGIHVTSKDVNAAIHDMRKKLKSDKAWSDYLRQSTSSESSIRIEVEASLLNEKIAQKVAPKAKDAEDKERVTAEWMTRFRLSRAIAPASAMPENLSYDIDLAPYKDPEAGFAIPGVGFSMQYTASGKSYEPGLENARAARCAVSSDFSLAINENNDVYAWIYIPGILSAPILQHPTDDSFYLSHTMDKKSSPLGEVYSERANSLDFSDDMTVLYGHAYSDANVVLSPLHQLENSETFEKTPEFYIFTPHKTLIYEIVSSYEYPDVHLLEMFAGASGKARQEYYVILQTRNQERSRS